MGGLAVSGATDHLPRLLALVPWLLAHPGTQVADVAREFEVTEAQLRNDLNLLWMCGLPGYGPGDLIDVSWHGDRVTLSNADEIARPLRLTPEEALALVAALRVLSEVPGIVERSAIDRALAKLEAAAGSAQPPPIGSWRRQPPDGDAEVVTHRHRCAGPGPPAAPALLGAGPRRGHRARRRPDPGVHHRRRGPTSPASATWSMTCGPSGSTGCSRRRCSTSRSTCPTRPGAGPSTPSCSRRPRTTAW